MKEARRIRWKTFLVVAALIVAALLCIRLVPRLNDSQYRSGLVMLECALLVLWIPVWGLLFSGMRWRFRLLVVAAAVGAGIVLVSVIRIDGYHGDILPQLGWVWEPRPGEVYDELELNVAAWLEDVPGALDSPEFLGPGRTNRVAPDALSATWFEVEPVERWRRKIGLGWSSFAVARGLAITQEQRGEEECVVAYALDDGAAIWTHGHEARFSEALGGDGPRATPTIAGERVLTFGATGILDCLDLRTGEPRWTRRTLAESEHLNLEWGMSSSPLVVGDLVIVTLGKGPGGSLAAYDLESGEPRWRTGEFEGSYSSPVLRSLHGEEQLVIVYATHLAGHRVETGELLWSTPIPEAAANVANPVVLPPDRVLVSIGYGKGARLFEVTRKEDGAWDASEAWRSMAMKAKFTNLVVQGEHVLGLDEGRLACIDPDTGRRVWKGSRWGHGQVLGVGSHLLIQAESGEVAIVEASAEGERVLQRFDVLGSKTWNQPVLAGRYLLVRNDREAACYVYPGP